MQNKYTPLIYLFSFIIGTFFPTHSLQAQLDVDLEILPDQSIYCYNDEVNLMATVEDGAPPYQLDWYNNNNILICEDCGTTFELPTPLLNEYTVVVTDDEGESANSSISINVASLNAELETDLSNQCYAFDSPQPLQVV